MAFSGRTGSDRCGLRNRSDTLSSVHPKLGARSAPRTGSGESVLNATTTEIMLARTVSLGGVHAYLRASGWVRDDSSRRESADIYLRPEDNREAAIIPTSEAYADYGTRTYQVAEQIGRVERRRRLTVLTDLAYAESDIVRVRLPNAHADNTLGLTDAMSVLEAARDLLLAAACSADRPQRMYRAGRNKLAARYLSSVRLGHSEPGSDMIHLVSPVAPAFTKQGAPFVPEDPLGRRVTLKLVSGLRASRQVVDRFNRGDTDFREFESRLREGISANLCRSVARLTEAGGGLEVSVSWAATRPAEAVDGKRVAVSFRPSDVAVLDEAARVLSNRHERTDEKIQGHVSRLSRKQADPKGTATIEAFVDGKPTSVRPIFDSADYSEVKRAHYTRLSVSLEEEIRHDGRRWQLRDSRRVSVLEEDSVGGKRGHPVARTAAAACSRTVGRAGRIEAPDHGLTVRRGIAPPRVPG